MCIRDREYIGETVGVFMPSPSNSDEELRRLELALEEMPLRRPSLVRPPEPYVLPRQFLSISEAMARPHVVLPLEQCQDVYKRQPLHRPAGRRGYDHRRIAGHRHHRDRGNHSH